MKKHFYISFLGLLCLSLMSNAQSSKKELMNRLDEFLNDFSSTSSFREIGGTEFSESQAKKFKEMFAENAIVFDDIDASVVEDNLGGSPYQLKNKPLDEYIADVRKGFPAGIRVEILNSTINFDRLDSNLISVVIQKKVSGKSSTLNRFENNDTLLLELAVVNGNSFLIKKISMIGSSFSCANDKDNDGVIDEQDACPGIKGEIRFKGCLDRDRDGIPDNEDPCPEEYGSSFNKGCPNEVFTNKYGIDLFLGFVVNTPKNPVFEKSTLAFDEVDLENTKTGTLAYVSKSATSLINGLEVSLSLNKNNTAAIGLGINYNKFTMDVAWDGFHSEYKEVDRNPVHYPFRRLLTLKDTREHWESTYLTIPVMLKFRKRLQEKIGIYYELGPAFDLIGISTTTSSVADKEAIYVAGTIANEPWTYSKNYQYSQSDWIITRDVVNAYSNTGAATYFDMLQKSGYDVALDKALTGKSEKISRIGFSGIARVGAFYMIDQSFSVFVGAVYSIHFSSKKQDANYSPVGKDNDYQSVLNGISKYDGQNFGAMLGLKYGFGK